MGSFNATCIISNLQIEAGTPVRFFLLTGAKYKDGNDHSCYVWGRWQLRGAAIRAKYNDYGSIEDIKESLTSKLLFEALNRDVVEKGVGDNECHDVQVRSGMSQEDWLAALWEGRVFVQDHRFVFDKNWKPSEPEEGIPSLTRIEKVLTGEQLAVVTAWGAKGYFLDEVSRGFIRIRHELQKENLAPLERIVPLLQKAGYAAMITCGTGNYANRAEVLVAPMPAQNRHVHSKGVSEEEDRHTKPRPVSQVMVREDVWKILLRTTFRSWDGLFGIKRMREDALAWLKVTQERTASMNTSFGKDLAKALLLAEDFERNNIFSQAIYGGEGVSGYSLRDAFRLGIELAENAEELEQYVLDLAEMAYVQMVYGGSLHGQWHPTTNSGQDPHWKEHRAFLKKLSAIRGAYEDD